MEWNSVCATSPSLHQDAWDSQALTWLSITAVKNDVEIPAVHSTSNEIVLVICKGGVVWKCLLLSSSSCVFWCLMAILCVIAVRFQSFYVNIALNFNAMFSSAVSKLSHEMVFSAVDHMLDILVYPGTLLIATIMVYEWISWWTSTITNDMVNGPTSAVVLQSTGTSVSENQQI